MVWALFLIATIFGFGMGYIVAYRRWMLRDVPTARDCNWNPNPAPDGPPPVSQTRATKC